MKPPEEIVSPIIMHLQYIAGSCEMFKAMYMPAAFIPAFNFSIPSLSHYSDSFFACVILHALLAAALNTKWLYHDDSCNRFLAIKCRFTVMDIKYHYHKFVAVIFTIYTIE